MYGRRRVGKTFLINEVLGDGMVFHHTGLSPYDRRSKVTLKAQLQNFYFSLIRHGMENIEQPKSWMEAFFLLEQLHSAVGEGEYIEKIQYSPHEKGDVLMLTGVGDVFPFMRVHTLLEALQPYFSDIPILVLYPGEFDGHHLKLFNRLQPNDYYRAFNII